MAAMSNRPDWDLAIIAAVGGGALMAYVTQARLSAQAAERALYEAQRDEKLQHTLSRLLLGDEAVAVMLVDRNDRIVAASKGTLNRLNLETIKGLRFGDIAPMGAERWRETFERSLAGEHVRHEEDELDLPGGRHWYTWETKPWRDENGEIRGVFAAGHDITSLVAARKAVAGSHDLLHVALDAGSSVIWEVDYKTRNIRWYGDYTGIYGEAFSFDEFEANTTRIIHNDDREQLADYFKGIAAGEEGSIEHRVVRADGSITWAQISARRGIGRSGGVRKLIVMSKDITERKRQEIAFIAAMQRAEASLKAKRALFAEVVEGEAAAEVSIAHADVGIADMYDHLAVLIEEMDTRDAVLAETLASLRVARDSADAANLSKSQFLASMSHELRTPLNAIIGYSEILQEEAEADGRDTDLADIERVLAAARQLLHLINDILDLSKIEAGRMDVMASEFEMRAVIEEAVATVRPSVEKNGNRVRVEAQSGLGAAFTDAFKLNQCLLNLLSNAAKFTREGDIVVRVRRIADTAGDFFEVEVSDSGIGMTAEQTQRLFNAYVQADAATERKFGGTGLGLVITRRTMQLLGGDVLVRSTLGEGSTFTLRFPAYLRAATPAASEEHADDGDRIVLVIDDAESARDLASRALGRLGFQVRSSASGAEGLALAKQLSPSLVLLDINLPDVSGWDILAAFKADPHTANLPIIVHSVDSDRARALKTGACEMLVKPADRDLLTATALRFARGGARAGEHHLTNVTKKTA